MRTLGTVSAYMILVACATVMVGRSEAIAQVDECRRMALQEQADSIALFDSATTKNKQQLDTWIDKTKTLLNALQSNLASTGRYGDETVFDHVSTSPAQVATEISSEVDAASHAVVQNLKVLERQLDATP